MPEKKIENRKHMRLPIEVAAELSISDKTKQPCETKNISFGGMSVNSKDPLKVAPGDEYNITLLLQEKPEEINIKFKCTVVHTSSDKKEIGLKFININGENYQDFKSLMINHSPDQDSLLDELNENPGLDTQK
jgi:c-di-GMP-binding flagellar brake protein YcgR